MRIAIDIPVHFPPIWKIASGALEYETRVKREDRAAEITIVLPQASLSSPEDRDPDSWDGVIARTPCKNFDKPQVYISSDYMAKGVSVTVSHDAITKLVIDQFVSMGLTGLAFFGNPNWTVCSDRWKSFSHYAEKLGMNPVFISSKGEDSPELELCRLRKPCGMMAFNDNLAFRLFRICKEIDLKVPRDVHVISVDNMPACLDSSPTLSSISMPFGLVGYHAARLCAQMIKGKAVESLQLPPSGLLIRDSINVGNEDIRTASAIAHYLRTNVSYPIQMTDIARRSCLSRRRLEQIFKSSYGVSPMAYLRQVRVDQVKKILESTDAPLKDIANECGFSNSIYLCQVFKKVVGISPILYRQRHCEGKDNP